MYGTLIKNRLNVAILKTFILNVMTFYTIVLLNKSTWNCIVAYKKDDVLKISFGGHTLSSLYLKP